MAYTRWAEKGSGCKWCCFQADCCVFQICKRNDTAWYPKDIYLRLLDVWGKCRQILYDTYSSGMEKYPIVASCRTTQNVPSKYLEQNGWTLLLFLYKIVGVARPILGYLHIFCYKNVQMSTQGGGWAPNQLSILRNLQVSGLIQQLTDFLDAWHETWMINVVGNLAVMIRQSEPKRYLQMGWNITPRSSFCSPKLPLFGHLCGSHVTPCLWFHHCWATFQLGAQRIEVNSLSRW